MGNIGKFVAMDILERMAILGNLLSSNAEKMTKTEAEKYKKFLEAEIKKLNEITKNKSKTA
jgi:succinate dehydrogenase flavin-adding protein (antitoxin of CptAB toxin-antitoxin module)